MNLISQHQRRSWSSTTKDIAYYLIFVVVVAVLSVRFDVGDRFVEWSRTHQEHQVHELAIVAMFMVAGLGVFGWRRWREAQREIASHQETLEELRVSEGRTQALQAASPDLVFRLDRDGTFRFVNESAALPMPTETIIGKNLSQVLPPDVAEQTSDAMRQIHAGSSEVVFRYEFPGRDGPEFWEARCVPVAGSEDVLFIARDITDSENQTTALRDLDGRFRAAFEDASIGMSLTSLSGRFMLVNRALCQLLGYSEEKLVGMKFLDVTHPDDRANSELKMQELDTGEVSAVRWEKRYVHADGHVVWAQLNLATVRDPKGKIRYYLSQVQDITPQQEAQAALVASEQRWKQTFEAAATGVALVNLEDGRFLSINQAGCDMLGHSQQELLTMTIREVTHPDDQQESFTRFRQVMTGEIPSSQVKLRYLRADNTTGHALVSTALLRDPEDRPLHLVAQIVDITEPVVAEQRLVDLLASKDELIASVSHELRTPLTAVVGYAQMLNDEVSGLSAVERKEMIESIASEGTDLTNIIEDLLVAARADIGRTVAQVPVNLLAQTAQVLETLHHDTNGRRIELTGPPVQAVGDPARVRQILRNLISNAIRYGGDRIQVTVDNGGPSVRIVVSDNGPGISPEEQDRIFEPYHRAHTRKGLTASVGLGLTVSRKLARLMNGDLTYTYQPGESSFQLCLPAAN
ncbi:MAG: PAS domain S-box protein [Acidimicrobiia bacterium]